MRRITSVFNKFDAASPMRFVILKHMMDFAASVPADGTEHPLLLLTRQLGNISNYLKVRARVQASVISIRPPPM